MDADTGVVFPRRLCFLRGGLATPPFAGCGPCRSSSVAPVVTEGAQTLDNTPTAEWGAVGATRGPAALEPPLAPVLVCDGGDRAGVAAFFPGLVSLPPAITQRTWCQAVEWGVGGVWVLWRG